MRILLNGRDHEGPEGETVLALLEMAGLPTGRVAVEVNGRVVPRGDLPHHVLQDGDRVEVVHFVGGG